MADIITKTLNTRISLKYDLYSNWSTNNPKLLKGEVALAYIPTDSSLPVGYTTVNGTTPPNVMVKVGDGEHQYNDLKFLSALAADVPAWAKAAAKPEYSADEINGLADYINTEIQDTDTQYTVVKVSDYQYKIMSKAIGETEFTTEVGVIDIPAYDDTALAGRVEDLEEALEVLNGAATVEGSVAKSIADAITALDLANTYAAKVHGHTIAEVEGLQDALDATNEAVEDLAEFVGELPEGTTATTLVGFVEEKTGAVATELGQYKTANNERVGAVEAEVDALQEQIVGLTGAMHFRGVVDAVPANGAEGYVSGDVVVVSSTKKEWVYDGEAWHELGDEGSYLTKTEAASTYETKADATSKQNALNQAIADEAARADAAEKANAKAIADHAAEAAETYETKEDAASKLAEAKQHATDLDAAMGLRVDGVKATADSAVQTVTAAADGGLKVERTGNDVTVAIDDTVTFIFDCGTSAV